MNTRDKELWSAISAEIASRLAALRENPLQNLPSQETVYSEEAIVLGKKVTFTHFKEVLPSGLMLVVVQAAVPAFLGMGWRGSEQGFVIESNGNIREATQKELGYIL